MLFPTFRTSDCLIISYTVYIAVQQKTPKAAWGLDFQGFKGQFATSSGFYFFSFIFELETKKIFT